MSAPPAHVADDGCPGAADQPDAGRMLTDVLSGWTRVGTAIRADIPDNDSVATTT